jgi:hypothetical protein
MNLEEAVAILNKYRNANYNSINEEEKNIAQALNIVLPKLKLGLLYQEFISISSVWCPEFKDQDRWRKIRKEIIEYENPPKQMPTKATHKPIRIGDVK